MIKKKTTRKSLNISSETGYRLRNTIATSKSETSLIASILRDIEPYGIGFQIGKCFYTEVSDCSCLIINDVDIILEPSCISESQTSIHGLALLVIGFIV